MRAPTPPRPPLRGFPWSFAWVSGLLLAFATIIHAATPVAFPPRESLPTESIRFAVIGDYGWVSQANQEVSAMVRQATPDFIITTGDNNYNLGEATTIDANVGQYYHDFIFPYQGSYGAGASQNRFFPSLGNHDWDTDSAAPYLAYFTLPGNERYYDFTWGPVHFFALDSDPREPDGISSTSVQALWLEERLRASTAPWKIVYLHHPPYSSAQHGPTPALQWPYEEWGASAVFAGHDHTYERIIRAGFPYFVNGLGGRSIYAFGVPAEGSEVRYNSDFGAMIVEASDEQMTFRFVTRAGSLVDEYTIAAPPTVTPTPTATPSATMTSSPTATPTPSVTLTPQRLYLPLLRR